MKKKLNRLLALALAVMMAVSVLPVVGARAEEAVTWTKLGSIEEAVGAGDVAITMTKGDVTWVLPSANSTSSNPTAVTATVEEDTLTTTGASDLYAWTITATEGGYHIQNANGYYLATAGTSTNGSRVHDGECVWSVREEGYLTASDGENQRCLGVNSSTNDWRAYKDSSGKVNSTISSQTVSFWKLGPAAPLEKVTTPTATLASESTVFQGKTVIFSCKPEGSTIMYSTTGPDSYDWQTLEGGKLTLNEVGEKTYYVKGTNKELPESDVAIFKYNVFADVVTNIADILAVEENGGLYKAKGVVTMVDGTNIYIQDDTGALCAYFGSAPSGIKLGDTITVSGNKTKYNNLPELEKAEFTKEETDTITLSATTKTLEQLTLADLCHYVEIQGLEVTEIGSKIKLKEVTSSKEIEIYNPKYPDELAVGDVVTVKAAVGENKGTIQLRNTDKSEITVTEYATPAAPTATPVSGSQVESGTEITVTSATAGATIEQSTDYADGAETAKWVEVEGGKLTVKGEVGAEVKFYVRAKRMAGGEAKYSDVVTLTYTVKAAEEKPEPTGETWVKVTEAPADGDWSGTYLIVHENGAESYVFNGEDKAKGHTKASIDNGVLTGDCANDTVTIEQTTGGYLIKFDKTANYIYNDSESAGLKMTTDKETAAKHVISISFDEKNEISIVSNNTHLRFNNSQDQLRFRFYSSAQTAIALYKPVEGEFVKNGTYVIWNPENNKALSKNYTGYYNSGVDVTPGDDSVSGYTDSEVWNLKRLSDGTYMIATLDGNLLSMAADNTSMPLDSGINYKWQIISLDDGTYNIKNVGRNAYIEWYAGANNPHWSAYHQIDADSKALFAQKLTPVTVAQTPVEPVEPEPEEPEEPADPGYEPQAGDTVVIYYPDGQQVMTSGLKGSSASASGSKLFTDGSELKLTVSVKDDVYTFTTADGKVLDTETNGGNLKLSAPESAAASGWKLVQADGGWYISNATAKWSSGDAVYVEYFNNAFTTYKAGSTGIYVMRFYKVADIGKDLATDSDIEDTIAQWGGGGPYGTEQSTEVKGDLYKTGDMLDAGAKFTVVAGGNQAQPYQRTEGSGSTDGSKNYNYYMGGKEIGAVSGDYMQFVLSTKGYGDMTLSFRMRVTAAGAKDYTLQYSTDGNAFSNFENGKYSYAYYDYGQSNTVSESGDITDGKAFGYVHGSKNDAEYVTFEFEVPVGAENAENLTIRLVPGTVKLNGNSGAIDGNIRIDSVKIVGSPITDPSLPGYVTAEPDGQEEDVPAGSKIALTASNTGAEAQYRFVKMDGTLLDGDWKTGNEATLPTELPIALEIKAVKDEAEGPVRRLIYQAGTVEAVKMSPNGGGVYLGADGTAKIVLTTNTFGAEIWYRTNLMKAGDDGIVPFVKYENPIELRTDFGTLTVDAYAKKAGLQDSAVITRTFTERGQDKYELYFGQMHSHTSYSDGAGTPQEAFDHVMGLSQDEYNMDFLSLTDHSNSFDGAGSGNTINDVPSSTEWNDGKALAASVTKTDKFVGIFGYEMTWSNGLGHINTFNTTGFQDRTQSAYTTYSTALQNYYEMLKTAPDSISQFNHPGTTFGDFSDFAHYDPEIDQLITLIEVGNGEGAIGSSGYFPSYEYYTRALDKGWHLAPTNNQDNHKGAWGSANNARDVVLVDELTEAAIYDAMRNYRVYATEDINLEIYYTFDGNIMGSRLEKSDVSDTATIKLELNDPDAKDRAEATVQVIVNGGKVAAEVKTTLDNQVVEIEVPTTYNYYYIKVVEADGDIAVTAPVWVGAVEAIGVGSMSAGSALTVSGEEQTFDISLYNNEAKTFEVESVKISVDGNTVSVIGITQIKKMDTAEGSFTYTFGADGKYTLTATVTGHFKGDEGNTKTFTKDLEVTVMPAKLVTRVLVDGTHYNDYVTGYYGGNMGNMTAIAANNAVQVTVVEDKITPEMLENCSLLVLSAPARKSGTANAGSYEPSAWDAAFIAMVKEYVEGGGNVIVTGLADYQDGGKDTDYQTSVQQNKLLAGIGSTMQINDDEVYDEVNNGGQEYRLYPEIFNTQSPWTAGIVTKDSVKEGESYQTYSQYSGCSVDPGSGTWLVKGFDTTHSIDSDKDGKGGIEKGNPVYFLAHEKVGAGNVFAAGGVFLSDFEVKAELDNIWDLPYANRTIFENILHTLCVTKDVTNIADTRKAELNKIFTVEGYVTAGRENANNAFFDAIYIQDETGGTCVFPYSTDGLKLGTKVRVLGYTDAYQGDRELQVISLTVLNDAPAVQEPKEVTTAEAADYDKLGGQLLKVSGTVSNVVMASGRISQFDLTDSSGTKCTVFIDGYIWDANGSDPITGKLQAGATATAVGLSYLHPEGDSEVSVCVLRVRDCGEITFTAVEDEDEDETPNVTTDDKTENGETTTETTAKPDAVVSGGKASSSVSSAMGAEIVDQARKNGSDTVTIAPEVKKDVDSASVTIPGGTVKSIGERTDADLKVETPVGDVTIPNEALAELGSGGRVTVSAERDGDAVSVEITSGGETVESVPGGIRAALPLEDGQVAVLVDADGNETIIPKSVVEDGVTYVVLDGSATVKVVDNSVEFEDVSDDDWFVGPVGFAASHGLVNGVGKASFAPGSDMTRAMLATVLWRLESEADAEGTGAFADVKSGLWYSEGVAWAGENGVINGTGNGNFEPERAVTRQEMAVMMYNYARFAGLDTTVGADLAAFGDGAEVDGWAKDAMAWAVAAGLIRGTGAGLEPDATATRAQVVTVMERLVGLMVK